MGIPDRTQPLTICVKGTPSAAQLVAASSRAGRSSVLIRPQSHYVVKSKSVYDDRLTVPQRSPPPDQPGDDLAGRKWVQCELGLYFLEQA